MASRKVIRRKPGRNDAGPHPNQEPRLAPCPSAPAAWLAIADAAAVILFVLAGMRSHDQGSLVGIFLRNAIPLLGAWFLVAAIFRTYHRPGLKVVVQTWIVAVPIGLVVRSMWVGSPQGGRIFVFLAVGLGFTLLFLLAGRAAVAVVSGRGYPQRRRARPPPA